MSPEERPKKILQEINLSEYKNLKLLHDFLLIQYKKKQYKGPEELSALFTQIHSVHNKIMLKEEIDSFNKLAKNRCKFNISEDCDKKFTNYFKHYQLHGNCCKKCAGLAFVISS